MSSHNGTIYPDDHDAGAPEALFGNSQLEALVILSYVLSAFSCLGSLSIVVSYFKCPRLHTFAFKLIMSLAVANIGEDVAYLIGTASTSDSIKCYIQGILSVYFSLVEFGLTSSIMYTCYAMIIKQQFVIQEKLFSVEAVCWSVPLVMALLPLSTNSYGDAGAWCSITSTNLSTWAAGTVWRFVIIFIPLWLSEVINFYMYFQVSRAAKGLEAAAYVEMPVQELREPSGVGVGVGVGSRASVTEHGGRSHPTFQKQQSSATLQIVNRLRLYPIALLFCWLPASVNRIYEAINPYNPLYWMYVLQYGCETIQGILNALIFFYTPVVKAELQDQWRKRGWIGGGKAVDPTRLLTPTVTPSRSTKT